MIGYDGKQRMTNLERQLYDDYGFLFFISESKLLLSNFQFTTAFKGLYSLNEIKFSDFLNEMNRIISKSFTKSLEIAPSKSVFNVKEVKRVNDIIESIIDNSDLRDIESEEFIEFLIISYIKSFNAISKNEIKILLERYGRAADHKNILESLSIQKKRIEYCNDGKYRLRKNSLHK